MEFRKNLGIASSGIINWRSKGREGGRLIYKNTVNQEKMIIKNFGTLIKFFKCPRNF